MKIFKALVFLACVLPLDSADYTVYIGDAYTYRVTAVATDSQGNTYLTGSRAVAVAASGSTLTDIFVSKLDVAGNVTLLATLSGKSSDQANGIALDPSGSIYIVGSTSSGDFPLHHPLQGVAANRGIGLTGFLVKLGADGTVLYSTYLGGTIGTSTMNAVAADATRKRLCHRRNLRVRLSAHTGPARRERGRQSWRSFRSLFCQNFPGR